MADRRVYFEDDDFLDLLSSLILTDRSFLKQFGDFIQPDDLKPRSGSPQANDRWLIVNKALEHWRKRYDPIGRQALSEFHAHAKVARFDSQRYKQGRSYIERLLNLKANPVAIGETVVEFRSQVRKAAAIDELLELQASGDLTDEKWDQLTRQAIHSGPGTGVQTVDYFETLQQRLERRATQKETRYPALMIPPLDQEVRAIARGQFGLVYGPWKRGKSQFLLWVGLAYSLQDLNVDYYTLEDPLPDVEDRLDAAISALPIKTLRDTPLRLKERFHKFRRLTKSRLQITDLTGGGHTVASIEREFLRKREDGFRADAVIIDYDDEIVPERKMAEKRFESAEIYRALRQFASRHDLLVWTGAQTAVEGMEKRQLGGEHLAEDKGKLRKVSFAVGLGKSDWQDDDALFLWVGAHKNDRQFVGANILANKERGLIYDHERTMEYLRRLKGRRLEE